MPATVTITPTRTAYTIGDAVVVAGAGLGNQGAHEAELWFGDGVEEELFIAPGTIDVDESITFDPFNIPDYPIAPGRRCRFRILDVDESADFFSPDFTLKGKNMNPFIPGPPDAALVLQAAVTKTADFNGAWLDLGPSFAPGGLGMPVAAVVEVTAAVRNDSDETYAFKLEDAAADASGVADAATVATISVPASVPVSGATATTGILLVKGFVTQRFVRLALDVGGTTPSITYSAHLNP
jgi:hypothetical protein